MAFFDKFTKAVSDTVDRGKKEVDQFMRIQKVKGDIGREEQAIRDAGARAQQVKQEIGDLVIARLKAGTLADAELQAQADRVAAVDADVAGHQAAIVEKRAEIARIEAEGAAPEAPAAPAPPLPSLPAAPEAPASVGLARRRCRAYGASLRGWGAAAAVRASGLRARGAAAVARGAVVSAGESGADQSGASARRGAGLRAGDPPHDRVPAVRGDHRRERLVLHGVRRKAGVRGRSAAYLPCT